MKQPQLVEASDFRDIATVTGSARCGTTLMMRMLHLGGIPAYADDLSSCESSRILGLPANAGWLTECHGRALKLLEPLQHRPLPRARWRFILMHRNPIEQARSQIKLLRLVEGAEVTATVDQFAVALRTDLPKMRKVLAARGPVLDLAFEHVLADPLAAAIKVQAFLGVRLDIFTMAAEAIPRSPECFNGMLELGLAELKPHVTPLSIAQAISER